MKRTVEKVHQDPVQEATYGWRGGGGGGQEGR